MDTAIVVFTRDLRLHDNPALHQACVRARQVVPLFVADPAIAAPPNRARFLAESLADLRASLRERGGDLVIRGGDPAAEVIALAGETRAGAVYLADDVSHYATARRRKLERECARHRLDAGRGANRAHPGRRGYAHFGALLADGDVAANAGNWQWVAGTGNNTRPNRVMNPLRQAQRFDHDGQYVRRYVPELAGLDPAYIQTPWRLPAAHREHLGYPGPIVELS